MNALILAIVGLLLLYIAHVLHLRVQRTARRQLLLARMHRMVARRSL